MLKMHSRAMRGLLPGCLAILCAVPAALAQAPISSGVEARLHAILEHNMLADDVFLSSQLGMHMRVEADGAGDLRGMLLAAPDFAFASGFSYTIRHDPRSGKDEVRLGFLFQECPDEARLINDWNMSPTHLQLGDGSASITRFASSDSDSVSFSLIYQTLNGICEAAFSQQVASRPRLNPPQRAASPAAVLPIPRALAGIMRNGDLRNHKVVSSALNMPLRAVAFHHIGKSAKNGLLLAEKVSPGVDPEMFSYVIQDTGWQPLYPFAKEPEILVNRRVSIHIPIDIEATCISASQVDAALNSEGIKAHVSQPGRNVLQWETRGNNTLTLLATRQEKCIEAFDFNQLTDAPHALPETPIFKLPARFANRVSRAADRDLIKRIAHRLHDETGYTLDFIAQLAGNAKMADFERMDAWLATLHGEFEAAGIASSAMESHLYPPAAAGTPARVFLVVARNTGHCSQMGDAFSGSILPSAIPCD